MFVNDQILQQDAVKWKASILCTHDEAVAMLDKDEILLDNPATGLASVICEENNPDIDLDLQGSWRIVGYYMQRPTPEQLKFLGEHIANFLPELVMVEKLGNENWLEMSQMGMTPVATNRFYIHTPDHATDDSGTRFNLLIPAGMAFGTGHHETTTGCAMMLEKIAGQGFHPRTILDLGSGTGVLAFAAKKLWPIAKILASDIDPVSTKIIADNAMLNGMEAGRKRGQIQVITANGMNHRQLRGNAPYQLIIANILAEPLVDMAASITKHIAPKGQLILAGLLNEQSDMVITAYQKNNMLLVDKLTLGNWTILRMRKRQKFGQYTPSTPSTP